jgi:hypothetical protein
MALYLLLAVLLLLRPPPLLQLLLPLLLPLPPLLLLAVPVLQPLRLRVLFAKFKNYVAFADKKCSTTWSSEPTRAERLGWGACSRTLYESTRKI